MKFRVNINHAGVRRGEVVERDEDDRATAKRVLARALTPVDDSGAPIPEDQLPESMRRSKPEVTKAAPAKKATAKKPSTRKAAAKKKAAPKATEPPPEDEAEPEAPADDEEDIENMRPSFSSTGVTTAITRD